MSNPISSLYLKFGSFVARNVSDSLSTDGFDTQDDSNEDVAVADLGTNDTPCIEFKDENILEYLDNMSCTPEERRTSALSYQSRYYVGNEKYKHRKEFNVNNLRIGDSCFYVPPSYINVSEVSNTVRESGIRMSTSVKLKHAYSTVNISIEMYFNGDEQINGFKVESPFTDVSYYVDGLRPFIAQCKLSPIMPVENEFLNYKNGIYAIAIQGVTISTVPGFPKLLKVLVDAVECNHSVYTMTPDYMFSDLIDWDLYKYNYQRLLTNIKCDSVNENSKLRIVENLSEEHKMSFSILSNISEINGDVNEYFDLSKAKYSTILDSTDNDFIIQQINFGLSNIVINTQLSNHTKPAIQYLGGNDSVFTVQISTSNSETVSLFKNLTSKTKYLSQQLRETTGTGFLKIDNNLINMLGVNYFLLETINIETVPNFPNRNIITLECISYDNVTANAEEINGFNPFEDDRKGTLEDCVKQNYSGLYNKISQDCIAELKMCDAMNLYPDLLLPTFKELDEVIPKINSFRENKGVKKLPFDEFPRSAIKEYKYGKPFVYDMYVNPDYYFLYAYNNLSKTIDSIDDLIVDKGSSEQLKTLLKESTGYNDSLIDKIKEKINSVILNKEVTNKVVDHTYMYTLEQVSANFNFNLSSFFNAGSNNGINGDSSGNNSSGTTNGSNIVANSATEAFLKFLWTKVDVCGYLYGSYGQIMTSELAQQMRNTYGSICRINNAWLGKQVFDCSGYVAWGMREVGYTETPARTSHTGLLPYCTKIQKSEIQPGDLLLSSGHIAVYIGNDETIEAMGADYGVCKGKVKDKYNIFARINWPQSVIDKWNNSKSNNNSNSNSSSSGSNGNTQTKLSSYSVSKNTKAPAQIVNDGAGNSSSNVKSNGKKLKAPSGMPKSAVDPSKMSSSQRAFIDKIVPGALKAYANHNILPSLTLVQAALESGWGKHSIGNNMFGIKATDEWKRNGGKTKWVWTYEEVNGVKGKYYLEFRDYDSVDDSVLDHSKILLLSRYSSVRQSSNYKEACTRVHQAGYATDSSYAKSLIATIESNGLAYWDGYEGYDSAPNTINNGNGSINQTTITMGKYGDDRDRHDDLITSASKKHGMSPNWFKALITQESNMKEKAGPNSCGAVGLMQITQDPCSELGIPYDVAKLKDPAYNIDVGMRYLKPYKAQVNNNYLDLACLHNCGPGRFADYQKGKKDLPNETKTHRGLVQKYYNQLISNGGQEGEYKEDGSVSLDGNNTSTPSGEGAGNEYYVVKTVVKVVKNHGKKLISNLPSRGGSGSPSHQMPYSLTKPSLYTPNNDNDEGSNEGNKDNGTFITVDTHSLPIGVPLTDYSPVNFILKDTDALNEDNKTDLMNQAAINTNAIVNLISSHSKSFFISNILFNKAKTEFDKVNEVNEDGFLSEEATSKTYNESLNKFKDKGNTTYLSTMTVDDAKYNARCSMLRAFPTYCILISDDNSNWYDGQKLWNNYYPYKSVVSISTFHEREQPVGTLKLSVTNLTNHLSKIPSRKSLKELMLNDLKSDENIIDGIHSNPIGIVSDVAKYGFSNMNYFLYKHFGFILGTPTITGGMIDAKNDLVKNMKLQPGARIHVRMGYGSNPLSLNVMFNGTVSEVSAGEILDIVAQSDGAELINNVVSLKESKKNNSFNDMGIEASSIITAMLTDRASWTHIVNPKWGEANKYNIEHFGTFTGSELKSFRTAEYDLCKNIYFGNYYKNFYCGGRTNLTEDEVENDEVVKESGGMGLSNFLNQAKEAGINVWKAYVTGATKSILGPIGDALGAADNTMNTVDGIGDIIDGDGSAEETIKMYVYNKTPWDVMQTTTSTLPEFICQPMYHQFDSRIYFGLPTWLTKYRYDMLPNGNIIEQAKSFQQVHLINYDDILDNRMRCSNKFFNTNVVSMYNVGGQLKATPTLYSDRTIDWSKQKTKVINTNIVQDYFGPDALYSMLGYQHGKTAAIGNALTNLIDGYDKQYYDEIITLGKPGIKPCDLIFVNDNFAEIYGLANVRTVTHTFSPQTGFVTNITPGLISYSKIEDTGCSNSHNSVANFYDLISNILESKKASIDKLNMISPYLYQVNVTNAENILNHCKKILENPSMDIDTWINELESITKDEKCKKYTLSREIRNEHLKELLKVNSNTYSLRHIRSFVFRLPIVTKITDYLRYGNCIIARPLLYKNSPFIAGVKGSENLIPGYSYNPFKPKDGDMDKKENRIEEFDEE